jgi:hypothetical protein
MQKAYSNRGEGDEEAVGSIPNMMEEDEIKRRDGN